MLYLKRILIVGLSFVVGLINIIGNNYTVFALEKNTLVHQNVMSMIQSQRGGLFDPIYTESLEDNWQGDYIYYGEDTDGSALKWQLLDSDNKDFSNEMQIVLCFCSLIRLLELVFGIVKMIMVLIIVM